MSTATFTHSLLLAVSLAAGRRSALWARAMAGLLLFVDSFINRCYFALATVPSRRYRSLAATVPSRLDGTAAGQATVPSTQSRSRYR